MKYLLLLVFIGGPGCSGQRSVSDHADTLVVAFADGFHSGVVLPRDQCPHDLLPLNVGEVALWPWVVVHFGERRWIRGEADSTLDALRLIMVRGDGGVQVDLAPALIHSCGGTRTEHLRLWVFPVTAAESTALQQRLQSWIASDSAPEQLGPSTCWRPSTRAWSLPNNCHDFTAELLEAAGIVVSRPPIMASWGLVDALDGAWEISEGSR